MANKDLENIKKRIEKLKAHLQKNKHDYTAKRKLAKRQGQLRKLKQYQEKK